MANPLQLSIVKFNKNSYIIVEGKQDATCFYIIRGGKVGLSKEVAIVEEEGGSILGPGDFFGVVSTRRNPPDPGCSPLPLPLPPLPY